MALIGQECLGQSKNEQTESHTEVFPAKSEWVDVSGTMTLTVLERMGNNFRGRLIVGDGVERTFIGTVHGETVAWLAKDVQATKGGIGGDNTGTIRGDRIEFGYRTATDKGSFTLRRNDKRSSKDEARKTLVNSPPQLDDNSFSE